MPLEHLEGKRNKPLPGGVVWGFRRMLLTPNVNGFLLLPRGLDVSGGFV